MTEGAAVNWRRLPSGVVSRWRLTVAGTVRTSFDAAGQGHWAVTAQLGAGTYKVRGLEVPETDEILY